MRAWRYSVGVLLVLSMALSGCGGLGALDSQKESGSAQATEGSSTASNADGSGAGSDENSSSGIGQESIEEARQLHERVTKVFPCPGPEYFFKDVDENPEGFGGTSNFFCDFDSTGLSLNGIVFVDKDLRDTGEFWDLINGGGEHVAPSVTGKNWLIQVSEPISDDIFDEPPSDPMSVSEALESIAHATGGTVMKAP